MELEEAKWENLPKDCLVEILGGVGIESLLYDVPLVCKSWFYASFDPMCWRILDFNQMERPHFMKGTVRSDKRVDTFIRSVVDRSRKSATKVVLPNNSRYRQVNRFRLVKALECISNKCPNLKILCLPTFYMDEDEQKLLPKLIVKWKSLEILEVDCYPLVVDILTQIQLHCNNFVGFFCTGCSIGHAEALSVISISGMKYLRINGCDIVREVLETIIMNCKNLELLDARTCKGYEGDSDLLNLASHIKLFLCEGSGFYHRDDVSSFDGIDLDEDYTSGSD